MAGGYDWIFREYLELHRVLAALAGRSGGVLEVGEDELAAVPADALMYRVAWPDGRVVLRVVIDEPVEPGRAG